jgi:hypothetical protein
LIRLGEIRDGELAGHTISISIHKQPSSEPARSTTPQAAGGEIEKKENRRCERDTGALAELMAAASALPDLLLQRRAALAQRWQRNIQLFEPWRRLCRC